MILLQSECVDIDKNLLLYIFFTLLISLIDESSLPAAKSALLFLDNRLSSAETRS